MLGGSVRFDVVSLDFDIDTRMDPRFGPINLDTFAPRFTGADCAKLMVASKMDRKTCVVIHSWNPPGAREIHAILTEGGFELILERQFGDRYLNLLQEVKETCR